MRRYFLGLAICTLTASAPLSAMGGDREIADSIITTLKSQQANGSLKGFDIDLSVENGIVTLSGSVATVDQAKAVIKAAQLTDDVIKIVNHMEVRGQGKAKPAMALASQSSVQPASGTDEAPLSMEADAVEPPKMLPTEESVSPQDAIITNTALGRLGKDKDAGFLRDFELDLSTVDGEVWVRGFVASPQQKAHVLRTVQQVPNVTKVIDDITVAGASKGTSVQPASTSRVVAHPQGGSSMPVMGPTVSGPGPVAFAPSSLVNYDGGAAPMADAGPSPVPMNMGPSYGAGVPRYDQPQMPGYAWPSYAAYPNYSAVTYPKQYSASAWPYIGPFYPYPQVPLGWRKVALEWDDGLWYLDFTSK